VEPEPFDESYDEYVSIVFNYLMSLTLNPELSEELTQDTFVKAYKSIDAFDGRCKMSVWLCQIAKNSYFSYRKKEQRKTSLDV
jgi:RNA polymerase sigma-70 factor (ECF subfamily)